MKTRKVILCITLCTSLIVSGFSFAFADNGNKDVTYMQQTVEKLGERLDGDKMFDYLSYVYLGWRTTGGRWQNQVIDTFIHNELVDAGYTNAGSGSTTTQGKSDNDKSSATDDDYAWVTYFNDINTLTWDPEYAKLEVTGGDNFEGKDALIERINVESYAFNPMTDAYLDHYGVKTIDEMWQWIIKKDANGNRVNVLNGKEAELNKRVHLAWNSCFTDEAGTNPADAKGIKGEAVYVGTVNKTNNTCSEGYSPEQLKGKVLLSDSSLRNTFAFAQNVGAVAVASKASLSSYSVPKDENGNIVAPFEKSARYASGATLANTKAQTDTGNPIVEWQFSNDQYDALKELLAKSESPVYVNNISVGTTYAMNDNPYGSKGQAIALAEIKGSTKPDERIFMCAHVQEPGSNDNATGVATLLNMATEMKRMIDSGEMERPERTITFMWGDEMRMATCYMSSHKAEKEKIISVLNLDMTGEDPNKTGGAMRIEKTPDPSAVYNYTLDTLSWENTAGYDETFKDGDGNFVRLPDSHTLWGAGSIDGIFQKGFYLNDIYMYATQNVIQHHDNTFQVDVCPYEGGSDHSRFLEQNVPALLTWHFTDYTYHTSVDTLAMSSAAEMENVGITSLSAALIMANASDNNEDLAKEMLTEVRNAAFVRFEKEQQNTLNHQIYASKNGVDFAQALANEKEVLTAWHDWYQEALMSVEESLLDSPSESYKKLRAQYQLELELRLDQATKFAEEMIKAEPGHTDVIKVPAKDASAEADGNIEYYFCKYCGKYYADKECTKEITLEDTIVKYVPADPQNPPAKPGDGDNNDGKDDANKPTPPTGDNNNIAILMMTLLAAAASICGIAVKRKNR